MTLPIAFAMTILALALATIVATAGYIISRVGS
jgi:hypothetical protein